MAYMEGTVLEWWRKERQKPVATVEEFERVTASMAPGRRERLRMRWKKRGGGKVKAAPKPPPPKAPPKVSSPLKKVENKKKVFQV